MLVRQLLPVVLFAACVEREAQRTLSDSGDDATIDRPQYEGAASADMLAEGPTADAALNDASTDHNDFVDAPMDAAGDLPIDRSAIEDDVGRDSSLEVAVQRDVTMAPPQDPAVQVSCSNYDQRCLLTYSGRVYCWGPELRDTPPATLPRLIPLPRPAVQVNAENITVMAIDDERKAWIWGDISAAELTLACREVRGSDYFQTNVPHRVDAFGDVLEASTRWGRKTLIERNGAGWLFNYDSPGRCNRWIRYWSSGVRRLGWIDEALCAVTEAGTLECVTVGPPAIDPRLPSLQLGATPVVQDEVRDVVDVSLGYFGQCVIHRDGGLSCWGYAGRGHMGRPAAALPGDREQWRPTRVPGLSGVRQVQFNYYEMMALTADGTLWSWGPARSNIDVEAQPEPCPEPGWGSCINTPSRVRGVRDVTNFSACHGNGYCAVTREGRVFCTGNWPGDGTTAARNTPVEVRWE